MLNAYTYWRLLNENKIVPTEGEALKRVIRLLIEEPSDFVEQLEILLDTI